MRRALPSKHETLNQCWFDVGPSSPTLGQHQINIGSTSRVCWMGCCIHLSRAELSCAGSPESLWTAAARQTNRHTKKRPMVNSAKKQFPIITRHRSWEWWNWDKFPTLWGICLCNIVVGSEWQFAWEEFSFCWFMARLLAGWRQVNVRRL